MKKDFDKWNKKKKQLENREDTPFYHEREVWWCSLGVNVGFEQDGKRDEFSRPVLVLKGFSKEVFLCVPLTTREKKGKYYCSIALGDKMSRKVILSQIRLVDTKRLQEKITTIDKNQFQEIKQAVIRLIE